MTRPVANDYQSQRMAPQSAPQNEENRARVRRAVRIERFVARCKDVGLEPTAQRRVIYRRLADSLDHPSAETVWTRVREELPRVSLATVYRSLRSFAEKGLVEELAIGGSVVRWDANDDEHHHLICENCAAVVDYYGADLDLDGIVDRVGSRVGGFAVRSARVSVFGTCPECRDSDNGTRKHLN
ncbi:MAG: Fur family peroxide stress response transcriptional regulator [Hyphomicrobiaceae bacterium]